MTPSQQDTPPQDTSQEPKAPKFRRAKKVTKRERRDLLAAAPPDLWGLLTRGEFYSEYAEQQAGEWVDQLIQVYGSAMNLAIDLGWNDAWRLRLSEYVYGNRGALRDGLALALYNDLSEKVEGVSADTLMYGDHERALKARLRYLQRYVFENDTKRMASYLTGIGYDDLQWTPVPSRMQQVAQRWEAIKEAAENAGLPEPTTSDYRAYQKLPDSATWAERVSAVLGKSNKEVAEEAGRLYKEKWSRAVVVSRERMHRSAFRPGYTVGEDLLGALVYLGINPDWLRTGEGEPLPSGFDVEGFWRRHKMNEDLKGDRYLLFRRERLEAEAEEPEEAA